jgi:hypothetical protein
MLVGVPLGSFGADENDPEKDLPKRGVLSSTNVGGYGSREVDEPWGFDDSGRETAPITGSVSRQGGRWVARIFNNHPDNTYSADVQVNLFNRNGTKVQSGSFSLTLKPGQSVERTVSGPANVESANVELKGWKNLTKGSEKGSTESKG